MVGDYLLIDSQGIGTWLVLISVSATVALWPLDWTAICCRSKTWRFIGWLLETSAHVASCQFFLKVDASA